MLDTDNGVDAISGRKKGGAISALGRLTGIALIGALLVMTIAILL